MTFAQKWAIESIRDEHGPLRRVDVTWTSRSPNHRAVVVEQAEADPPMAWIVRTNGQIERYF